MDKLRLWASARERHAGACSYYRIHTPFLQLDKLGFGEATIDTGDHFYGQLAINAMIASDICLLYSQQGDDALHQAKTLRKINPVKKDDVWLYPPTLIYDADDNADFVHFMNQTFVHLGVRDGEGNFLEPSSDEEQTVLSFKWDNGEIEELWKDKETQSSNGMIFDIQRNLQILKVRHRLIRECHGATATTPALASYFREVVGQPNVHVFPNTVVLDDYEFFEVPRKDDKIRILWQGSVSHYLDWYRLKDALATISKKYEDKITWVIYGTKFDWIHKAIPEHMFEYCHWSPYDAYKLRRGLLNIDINLCPLADNVFNRCKSAIKWYEASIWPNPEATLAAKVEPYFEIEHNKTGLLYTTPEDFVNKLSALIENADLRKRLANGAKDWVMHNRLPEHTIPPLAEFYRETREKQKRDTNPLVKLGTDQDFKQLIKATR